MIASLRDRWRRLPVTARDLPVALALIGIALTPPMKGHGTQVGELPARPFDQWALVVIALECLPLTVRRRFPALGLALVSAGFAADQLLRYHTASGTALAFALVSAGAHVGRHRIVTVIGASLAYVALCVALDRLGSTEGLPGFITFYLLLGLAWGTGVWLRQTRAAEAERRQHLAAATRAAERTRIARELHDVVTHHVTAMVVQADSARYLTADPARLDQAITAVSDTGRLALTDLRHLLDLLNPAPPPARSPVASPSPDLDDRSPGVGDMGTLVERMRRSGQPVEFVEEGAPASTGGAEAVAYRVVRESLTNALKHAQGSPTAVHVRRGAKEITVEVLTSSSSGPSRFEPGGRGLTGLRERVGVLGGDFRAEPRPGGGFAVHARIPS